MSVLLVSCTLFALGAYGVMSRRNLISMLMCIEIMFNAANLNLVYFSRAGGVGLAGQVFAALIIAVAAAESAVGLALALAVFRHFRSIVTDELDVMRG